MTRQIRVQSEGPVEPGLVRRDRGATRALVLGLLGLPFGIFAPFAVWSGLRSVRRIRASHGELRGETPAMAGLVAGLMGIAVIVFGWAYWLLST